MATKTAEVGKDVVYDPDGSYAPLTIEFPESTLLISGQEFRTVNINRTSATTIALAANANSPLDEILDPTDRASAPASSHASIVTTRLTIIWTLYKGNGFAVPTWWCHVFDQV